MTKDMYGAIGKYGGRDGGCRGGVSQLRAEWQSARS